MSEIVNIIVNESPANPAIKIVKTAGQLDETSLATFSKNLEDLLADASTTGFVLDFSELEFLNSKVIGS